MHVYDKLAVPGSALACSMSDSGQLVCWPAMPADSPCSLFLVAALALHELALQPQLQARAAEEVRPAKSIVDKHSKYAVWHVIASANCACLPNLKF